MTRRILSLVVLTLIGAAPAVAQRDWNAPFPAHHVIDNVYFVGTGQLGTFLITTAEGHILINSDFESTVPSIRASVEALGFDFEDIEIVLGSHAHGDHMEADALFKELTGAEVMVMRQDVERLRTLRPGGKEHPIDRILDDGDEVTLGDTTLVAHRTAGHTKGCTSWALEVEEQGETYLALIVGSFGVNPGYILVDNPDYPEIADDYRATFAKARSHAGRRLPRLARLLVRHGAQAGTGDEPRRGRPEPVHRPGRLPGPHRHAGAAVPGDAEGAAGRPLTG